MLGLLLAAGGLLLGAGGWIFHLRTVGKARMASAWPTVAGTITASEVIHKVETDADGESADVYYAEPRYSYSVDGAALTGKRIAFGATTRFDSARKAQAVIARYPVNAAVEVRYNPRKPSEAVLEGTRPSLAAPLILSAVGVIFVIVGLSLL